MQNSENLKKVFRAIKDCNAILGKDENNRNSQLREAIRYLRKYVLNNTLQDPLKDRLDHSICVSNSNKGFLRTTIGTMYRDSWEDIYPKNVWLDNYAAWRRDPEHVELRKKEYYFRIGDEFYDKEKYIEFNGKAYDKENYILLDDEIVEKSKVNICNYYVYDNGSYVGKMKELAIKSDDGEEFFNNQSSTDTKIVVRITNGVGGSLFCTDFVKSMFRIGNKRIMPSHNGSNIYLTREELKHFNFNISNSHALAIANNDDTLKKMVSFLTSTKEERIKLSKKKIIEAINQRVSFSINFYNPPRGTSLKQKLLNIIIGKISRRSYTKSFNGINELFERLKAIKKMYEVEEEYAN